MDKEELESLTKVIYNLLETDPRTRKDDYYLILQVALKRSPRIKGMDIVYVLERSDVFRLQPVDSITRIRRQIQKDNPKLKEYETVIQRAKEEKVHRRFFSYDT